MHLGLILALVQIVIGQYVGEQPPSHMTLQRAHMLPQIKAIRLARLRGDVADVQPERRGSLDRSPYVSDKQVRQYAGEQAPRARNDEVGI